MAEEVKNILTVVAVDATGEGLVVDTLQDVSGGSQYPKHTDIGDCRFYFSVTVFGGSSPTANIALVTIVNGVEHILGTFTEALAATQESIVIVQCPATVKAKYTLGGGSPVLTATIDAVRLYTR